VKDPLWDDPTIVQMMVDYALERPDRTPPTNFENGREYMLDGR
jgi:hypothetical protein